MGDWTLVCTAVTSSCKRQLQTKVENLHDEETANKYVGLNFELSLRLNATRLGAFLVGPSTS